MNKGNIAPVIKGEAKRDKGVRCHTCEFVRPCVLCVWVSRHEINMIYDGLMSWRNRVGAKKYKEHMKRKAEFKAKRKEYRPEIKKESNKKESKHIGRRV